MYISCLSDYYLRSVMVSVNEMPFFSIFVCCVLCVACYLRAAMLRILFHLDALARIALSRSIEFLLILARLCVYRAKW